MKGSGGILLTSKCKIDPIYASREKQILVADTMGIRIFFNEQQVDSIPPITIEGSHWDFDYVWRAQGNHIVLVDLYDMVENQEIHTYTFNMGTQNPFGYIFFGAIIVGALTLTVVVLYIYVPKSFKKSKD